MSSEENKKYQDLGKLLSGESQEQSDVHFQGLDSLWKEAGNYEFAEKASNDASWNAFKSKLTPVSADLPVLQKSWVRKYSWAAAAAVALLLVGAAGAWLSSTRDKAELVSAVDVTTGPNEYKTIDLADGSKVELNCNSHLVVAAGFNQLNRKIELTGQASFNVTRNIQLPFVVSAGATVTKVLGTAFDIEAYSNENVHIYVNHGKVAFGKGSDIVVLAKNQAALFDLKSAKIEKTGDSARTSWNNGDWVLKNTPISEIAVMFNHRFGKQLKYAENEAKRPFTGKFKSGSSAEEIKATLEEALQIKLIIE